MESYRLGRFSIWSLRTPRGCGTEGFGDSEIYLQRTTHVPWSATKFFLRSTCKGNFARSGDPKWSAVGWSKTPQLQWKRNKGMASHKRSPAHSDPSKSRAQVVPRSIQCLGYTFRWGTTWFLTDRLPKVTSYTSGIWSCRDLRFGRKIDISFVIKFGDIERFVKWERW